VSKLLKSQKYEKGRVQFPQEAEVAVNVNDELGSSGLGEKVQEAL
jgi:hypothetical protein